MSSIPPNPTDGENAPSLKSDNSELPSRLCIPAMVILERRMISRSFWSLPSWYLHTVAVGEHLIAGDALSTGKGSAAGQSDKGDLFAWTGFDVMLYKDACERYWHALIGDKPLVYVVCRDEADEAESCSANALNLRPVVVTLDYDDASAAAETDSPVLSAPVPAELYRYMERFVLAHYQPTEFKKRKRRNWSGEEGQPGRRGQNHADGRARGSNHE